MQALLGGFVCKSAGFAPSANQERTLLYDWQFGATRDMTEE